MKSKQIAVVDVDERGRCDSIAGMYRVNNLGGFNNDTSKPFHSPSGSPAILAQPFYGGLPNMGNYAQANNSLQSMLI